MIRGTNLKTWAVISVFFLGMVSIAAGRTIYVDDDGPADFKTIQAAINIAYNGDTVIVADGTYRGQGNRDIDFLGKAITVRSDNGPENCIIDCEKLGGAFYFNNSESWNSILDGLTITNQGFLLHGRICCSAIYCRYSNPTITNCIIIGNGTGMFISHSTSKITNCVITNNSGSGIQFFDSSPTITNCTVVDNRGYGIQCFWSSRPTITNSILWGNSSPQIDRIGPSNIVKVTYSNVQGGWGGEGNIDEDPCFISSTYYRLMPNSRCIDTGTNTPSMGLPETDIEGYPRSTDGDNDGVDVADMGAYESWPPSEPIIWLSDWKLEFIANEGGPNPPEQILTIHNSGDGTINWVISHNCQWLEVNPNAGTSTGQPNEVVLSVDVNGLLIGEYNCVLTISDPNAINTPLRVIVNLYVGTPLIGVAPTGVYFLYPVGAPSPEPQTISIWNDAIGRLDWQIIEDCNWLHVDPNAGSSTMQANEVTLSVDISGLAPNMYNCQLTITAEGAVNSPQIIQVNLHIYDNHGELHVPSQYPTIQTAINISLGGNEIIVSAGTYYQNINVRGKNIILRSTAPTDPGVVANTIIDGRQSGSVVTFSGTESASCVLSGFTITNGRGTYACGGGIRGNGTLATIQYNVISGNKAGPSGWPGSGYGGGLYDCDGIIQNNEISWNQSIANEGSADGCGLYGCDGTIRNNTISYNSFGGLAWGGDGGGMHCKYGSPTVTNCTFSNNSATEIGGGIYSEGGSLTISNCTFSNNWAESFGGGMYNDSGSPTVTNCIFIGNSAAGGVGMLNYGNATLTNCIFISNTSVPSYVVFYPWGGGLFTYGSASLTNCIFIGNSAKQGGGIHNFYCNSTLTNCTFAENSATNGNALACDSYPQQEPSNLQLANCILWDGGDEILNNDGSTISIIYSDVYGGETQIYDPCEGVVWGAGNIDADPCFAQPAYWDPNGTPEDVNDDFWVPGDYHLKSQAGRWDANEGRWTKDEVTSPCIDAGNPNSPIGYEPFPNGGIINMGAYGGTKEASKSYFGQPVCEIIVAGDINGDCKVNFLDFRLMALHWLEDRS